MVVTVLDAEGERAKYMQGFYLSKFLLSYESVLETCVPEMALSTARFHPAVPCEAPHIQRPLTICAFLTIASCNVIRVQPCAFGGTCCVAALAANFCFFIFILCDEGQLSWRNILEF